MDASTDLQRTQDENRDTALELLAIKSLDSNEDCSACDVFTFNQQTFKERIRNSPEDSNNQQICQMGQKRSPTPTTQAR
ncbi:hypothetical protein chiPu_0009030 [Chiloscyllium punctatum]|uniref:Uncharacterized protein n=1 Tax=Chiloscyllium punctatum TaxID=137246 RepID=A0A401SJH5_CHIPU|nr:hypothetical protein [Chiloscyllium punctatum]